MQRVGRHWVESGVSEIGNVRIDRIGFGDEFQEP